MPKVKLVSDFTDEYGQTFAAGQLGETIGAVTETAIVNFYGYDNERARDKRLREQTGEGANIVPWLAEIPVSLIEFLD